VEMPAVDIRRSADFYSKVFGWQIRRRGDGATAFDDTTGQVSGSWVVGRPAAAQPGLLIYIMVDSVAATIETVVAHGGVLVQMIEQGATHLGVATDHIIESFRNALWSDYKTGEGIEPALLAQFHPLEGALAAMGVAVWPMTELEADDALASAARLASHDDRVQQVCIWTPDKDLAQCVSGDRVVQVDRKSRTIRNATGVREK